VSAANSSAGAQSGFKYDPFNNKDPFINKTGVEEPDPFQSEDPFASKAADGSFAGKNRSFYCVCVLLCMCIVYVLCM